MSAIVDYLRTSVLNLRSGLEAASADTVSAEKWYIPYLMNLVRCSFLFALILADHLTRMLPMPLASMPVSTSGTMVLSASSS